MAWVRVDDKAVQHPKLLSIGAEGVCLWLAGLCHCNSYATDGLIRKEFVDALYPLPRGKARRLAARMVEVRLWIDEGSSFRIHNYERYQAAASKAEAEAKAAEYEERKRRERERKRTWRAGKAAETAPNVPDVPSTSHGTNGSGPAGQSPGPSADGDEAVPRVRVCAPAGVSRPVPSRPDPRSSREDCPAVDDRQPSQAAAAAADKGSEPISSQEVAAEWHRVGSPIFRGVLFHPHEHHRKHFVAIASALNQCDGDPRKALQAVVGYFWLAANGPVGSGRVKVPAPEMLASGITRDLLEAAAWWEQQKIVSRETREAAQ